MPQEFAQAVNPAFVYRGFKLAPRTVAQVLGDVKIEYLSVEGIVDIAVGGVITLGDLVMSESSAPAINCCCCPGSCGWERGI